MEWCDILGFNGSSNELLNEISQIIFLNKESNLSEHSEETLKEIFFELLTHAKSV